jgi:hypothetical protein
VYITYYCLQIPRIELSTLHEIDPLAIPHNWASPPVIPQQLPASQRAVAALAAAPTRLGSIQPTDMLPEPIRHQGDQPVIISPSQEDLGRQREVLHTVQPLLTQLPHVTLTIYKDLGLPSTAIIGDVLGPTTTKLRLQLCTMQQGSGLSTVRLICKAGSPRVGPVTALKGLVCTAL